MDEDDDLADMLPAAITAEEVKRIREVTGDGLMTVKAKLEQQRTAAMIRTFDRHGDPRILTLILERLLGPVDYDYGS